MADLTGIEVVDMPSAGSVGNADYFMIVQSGVNKKAPKSLVLDGIATEDETGNKVDLEINSSTYVMVAKLYDKNNNLLSTSSPIDLPLETMVVGAEYDEETKEIVLTLKNGTTVRFSVADLVDGLVSEETFDEAVEALQNEISDLAAQIVTTETKEDTEFTINDTFDARMKIKIKGNTEQDSYSGKNLLSVNSDTYSYTNNQYKDVATNIQLTEAMVGQKISFSFKVQISGLTTTATVMSATLGYGDVSSTMVGNIKTINYNSVSEGTYEMKIEDCTVTNALVGKYLIVRYVSFNQRSNYTVLYSNAQIEFSATATSYEPYVGGLPSPSPDFPQSVRVVTGDNSVVVSNKNILPLTNQDFTIANVRFYVENGTLKLNGTASGNIWNNNSNFKTYFKFILPSGTYIFKRGTTLAQEYIRKYSNDTTLAQNNGSFTLTEETELYYSLYITTGTSFENVSDKSQLEKGNTATTYAAHAEQTYPISLGSIELCKIGTYQDYIVGSYNNWKVIKQVRHLSLAIADMDNMENYPGWTNQTQIVTDLSLTQNTVINNATSFKCNITTDKIMYANHTDRIWLVKDSWGLTQTQWQEQYPNLVFNLYYGITNTQAQTEIPITDATLITQLNNLADARSYVGQTNVSSTYESSNAPMVINATALTGGLLYKSAIVTSISAASTDEQIPSAKCVYGIVGDINTLLDNLNRGGNIVWEQQ